MKFSHEAANAATDAERVKLLAHAWRVVQEAHEQGPVPNEILSALIGAYCSSGLVEHAESVLGMYPEFGCSPDAEGYELILDSLKGSPAQFRRLYNTGRVYI